jgi:hypothetical protein
MPRQNEDTPEPALAFAKEILDWEDAEISDRQADWFIKRAELNRKSPDSQWSFGISQIDVVVGMIRVATERMISSKKIVSLIEHSVRSVIMIRIHSRRPIPFQNATQAAHTYHEIPVPPGP